MSALYLGHCDSGCIPLKPESFLETFHNVPGARALKNCVSFRDDDRSTWRRFKEVSNNNFSVSDLHAFLIDAGFMPRKRNHPIFDYVTQASVRLFQEYVRTVDNISDMVPDGIAGSITQAHMKRWMLQKKRCAWAEETQSAEYTFWINALKQAKLAYTKNPASMLHKVNNYGGLSDTRNTSEWSFSSDNIHLIGLRTGEQKVTQRRASNDVFILLVNGKVFKFWGSTDPNPTMSDRKDQPFLVEGQHKYRFSWHKVNDKQKLYRALRPYQHGVLVLRDHDKDSALTLHDIKAGVDPKTDHTVNIHWSGIGTSNWSAGCQVIAGKSYINPDEQVVDCSLFAASSYSQLNKAHRKTKAAYNMLTDLVLCYAPQSVDYLLYSLGRDESFNLTDAVSASFVADTFASMQV